MEDMADITAGRIGGTATGAVTDKSKKPGSDASGLLLVKSPIVIACHKTRSVCAGEQSNEVIEAKSIAARSLSPGTHSRDPLRRNDEEAQ
jgi:hypothetical protein